MNHLPLFTASAAERVAACPASASLPAVNDTSEDAERGVAGHRFCRAVLSGIPREMALLHVPRDLRGTCERLDFKSAVGDLTGVRAEVSYAINARAHEARFLGVNLHRRYRVEDGWIPGTNDFEGTDFLGRYVVGDWKFGLEVTPAVDNWQAQFHARALALAMGVDEVESRICYVRESGHVHVDRHVFKAFALDSFHDDLAEAYERAVHVRAELQAGAIPAVHPGSHCRYCPALVACPAQVALARVMTSELTSLQDHVAALSPEQAGVAWRKLKAIEVVFDAVKEGLKQYAMQHPIPLDARKEVRELTFKRASFSRERAVQLLRAKGATDEEIASCEIPSDVSQVRELKRRSA